MPLAGEMASSGEQTPRKETAAATLDYSQRLQVSWAIYWPHLALVGVLLAGMFLILFLAILVKPPQGGPPPLIVRLLPVLYGGAMLSSPFLFTPWAVSRAVRASYAGFRLEAHRAVDPTAQVSRSDWIGPAWFWLWRNWIVMFPLSLLIGFVVGPQRTPSFSGVLALLLSFAAGLFIASPWAVGGMIARRYGTTLEFTVQRDSGR